MRTFLSQVLYYPTLVLMLSLENSLQLSLVLDLAGKILEVGDQICYIYYVPVEEKRSKVFPLRKICNADTWNVMSYQD